MTTSLKDVSSAQMIKSMAELGCFEYEDTAYGCAYRKDGKVLYRMGGDWQRIHDFIENSRLAGILAIVMRFLGFTFITWLSCSSE